jgi:F-type H+-transporting ATPase subunit delta
LANERLARRYATAIFALAREAQILDAIGTELLATNTILESDSEFRTFFRSPMVSRNAKITALSSAFEGRIHTITLHTLFLLVQKRREFIFSDIVRAYESLLREARGREALTITSARQLGSEELAMLVERMGVSYKTTFETRQEVDPRLIGGLRLRIGDRSIDGSVSGRIEALAATLFSLS